MILSPAQIAVLPKFLATLSGNDHLDLSEGSEAGTAVLYVLRGNKRVSRHCVIRADGTFIDLTASPSSG